MKNHWPNFIWLILCMGLFSCKTARKKNITELSPPKGPIYRVNPFPQTGGGDAQKGLEYLLNGDYVGNGIPYELFKKFAKQGKTIEKVVGRVGDNEELSYAYNVFTTAGGMKVVSGSCFTCHASKINGKLMLGLGNAQSDFTMNTTPQINILNWMVKNKLGKNSPQWKEYEEHANWLEAVAPAIVMNNPGINPAFRLEEALIAYRNPEDLSFTPIPRFEMPKEIIGTDVPPLWNVKHKNALYYNGMGRGDFSKLLMQACLLGIHDSTAARKVQENFVDVVAWLDNLEAPKYPGPIQTGLASKGRAIFKDNCSKCHGTYGEKKYYPNKIIPLDEVKTDPTYAEYAFRSEVNPWYNSSWFHESPPFAESRPSMGYMAPPLEGIWATAPFLHNASVPTIEALLNSKKRPVYWQKSGDPPSYNIEKMGWDYRVKSSGAGKHTFDTTLPGYGNQGHYFGDELSEEDRTALIEYLKTL